MDHRQFVKTIRSFDSNQVFALKQDHPVDFEVCMDWYSQTDDMIGMYASMEFTECLEQCGWKPTYSDLVIQRIAAMDRGYERIAIYLKMATEREYPLSSVCDHC